MNKFLRFYTTMQWHFLARVMLTLLGFGCLYAMVVPVSELFFARRGSFWQLLTGTTLQLVFYHTLDVLLSKRLRQKVIGDIRFNKELVLEEGWLWVLIALGSVLYSYWTATTTASFLGRVGHFVLVHAFGVAAICLANNATKIFSEEVFSEIQREREEQEKERANRPLTLKQKIAELKRIHALHTAEIRRTSRGEERQARLEAAKSMLQEKIDQLVAQSSPDEISPAKEVTK